MSLELIMNRKPIKAIISESFGDIFNNYCQGKFYDN